MGKFFDEIKAGLEDAIEYEKGKKSIVSHMIT